MSVITSYSPELLAQLPKRTPEQQAADLQAIRERAAHTIARIGRQVDANVALEKERIAALEWCRRNGNPHLEPKQ